MTPVKRGLEFGGTFSESGEGTGLCSTDSEC